MMPGGKRRLRLLTDWTVGLLFGRDSSELGQLGHPPALDDAGLEEVSASAATTARAEIPAAPGRRRPPRRGHSSTERARRAGRSRRGAHAAVDPDRRRRGRPAR